MAKIAIFPEELAVIGRDRDVRIVGHHIEQFFNYPIQILNSIDLSGAGKITGADINTPKLMVNVSGAGDITLTGKADSQDITCRARATITAITSPAKT